MSKEKNKGFFTKNSLYSLTDKEKAQLASIEGRDLRKKTKKFFKIFFTSLGILLLMLFSYSKDKADKERIENKIELDMQIEELKKSIKIAEKAVLARKNREQNKSNFP